MYKVSVRQTGLSDILPARQKTVKDNRAIAAEIAPELRADIALKQGIGGDKKTAALSRTSKKPWLFLRLVGAGGFEPPKS